MSTILNTAIKVQTDVITDAERLTYAIEEGSIVQTETGYWVVQDGQWRVLSVGALAPSGWVRWDDSQYTSSNKLTIGIGTTATLPNNANTITSYAITPTDLYNPSTKRVFGLNENDTYLCTIVFKMSAANANQTFGELKLEGGNGTPYERLSATVTFPKGNSVAHDFHQVFQYYTDADFVANGNYWSLTAVGGDIQIWDAIMFIQSVQLR